MKRLTQTTRVARAERAKDQRKTSRCAGVNDDGWRSGIRSWIVATQGSARGVRGGARNVACQTSAPRSHRGPRTTPHSDRGPRGARTARTATPSGAEGDDATAVAAASTSNEISRSGSPSAASPSTRPRT